MPYKENPLSPGYLTSIDEHLFSNSRVTHTEIKESLA